MQQSRPPDQATPHASRLSLLSWALFDWANQPYFTLITTFIFFPYFTSGFISNPVEGQILLGYTLAIAGLLIALLGPVWGALADASGARKPWLLVFSFFFVIACANLWAALPGAPQGPTFIAAMIILASVSIESAIIFYNAILPELTPPERMGRLSGFGWGLGYVGGLFSLFIMLFAFSLPGTGFPFVPDAPWLGIDPALNEAERLSGPFSALWYVVFVIPFFVFVPDRPSTRIGVTGAVGKGLKTLWGTFRHLRQYRNISIFLIARMFYNDGLAALFAFGGVYARGVFGWDVTALALFGIVLLIFSAIGAFLGGLLDDLWGSRTTIKVALGGLILGGVGAASITRSGILFVIATPSGGADAGLFTSLPEQVYLAFSALVGIAAGPVQAASRTFLARLAPRAMVTEFFGLYALSGKATTFAAPLLISWMTALFATQRASLFVILLFLFIGYMLLNRVDPLKKGPDSEVLINDGNGVCR